MKVSIIGTGNVGLAFGAALGLKGHDVLFHDIVEKKPTLGSFTRSFSEACAFGDMIVMCLRTDLDDASKVDLSILLQACRRLAEYIRSDKDHKVIIVRSTCLPGTAAQIVKLLYDEYQLLNGKDFDLAAFPSFLNMGQPLEDELRQKKCLIGVGDEASTELLGTLKELVYWTEPDFNSYENVEFAKYVNNVFHASIISIWNEIYVLGRRLSADTDWIAKVTPRETGLECIYRVHGLAWGGACLPKDTRALLAFSHELNVSMPILEAVIRTNELMAETFGVREQHWSELHR